MVSYHARRYSGNGLSHDELCAEGHVGLVEAALRFDPSFNYSFSTYAVWWVRKRMVDALFRQGQAVRVPMYQIRLERRLRRGVRTRVQVVSLDEPGTDSERPRRERLADPEANPLARVLRGEQRERVRRIVDRLPQRERTILRLRFGLGGAEPLSLRQLAARMGLSRERIRQIEQRCLELLRREHEATG